MDALDDSVRIFGASWLDDGTTLDGQPMADAAVKNTHMIASLRALETDVAHVGLTDAIALSRMSDPPDLPMVSANIQGQGYLPTSSSSTAGCAWASRVSPHRVTSPSRHRATFESSPPPPVTWSRSWQRSRTSSC